MDIPYTFEDELKVCTNKYRLQSQIDKLYLCLEDYEVSRSVDYCNLHPDKSIMDFDSPEMTRLNYLTLSKEPFFDCLDEV